MSNTLPHNIGISEEEVKQIQRIIFPMLGNGRESKISEDLRTIYAEYASERPEMLSFALFLYGQVYGMARVTDDFGLRLALEIENPIDPIKIAF